MIFQKLMFPTVCQCYNLYFNGQFKVDNNVVTMEHGDVLTTDTYFNAMPIKKILDYTRINTVSVSLEIIGKGKIQGCTAWVDGDKKLHTFEGKEQSFDNEEKNSIVVDYDPSIGGELFYVKIVAESDCILISGSFQSPIEEVNHVDLAIGICTYKREDYINRNLENLSKSALFNCHERPHVFVCDNAKTIQSTGYDWVTVIPNRNVGGSGGFTRCMIEIKKSERHFTHFILIDDDVNLDSQVIERTIGLLTILKPEYTEDIIGGAMLVLHEPWRQFENGALYKNGFLYFPNKNIDLRKVQSIIINSRESDINYNAWCYCCMPTSIMEKGLPLPLFIHMDDIEYCTREKRRIITMNGICVWHPFYANQRQTNIVFYDIRNNLIVFSRDNVSDIMNYALKLLDDRFLAIFRYDYNRFLAAYEGFNSFLKGIDYFKKTDPEKLNESLYKYRTNWLDIIKIDETEITKDVPPLTRPNSLFGMIRLLLSSEKKC